MPEPEQQEDLESSAPTRRGGRPSIETLVSEAVAAAMIPVIEQMAVAHRKLEEITDTAAHLEAQCFCLMSGLGWRRDSRPAPEGIRWVSGLSQATYELIYERAKERLSK